MANSALGIIIKATDQFSGTFGKLRSEVGATKAATAGLTSAFAAIVPAISTVAILGAIAKFSASAIGLAADVEEVEGAYKQLTASAGVSGDAMLASLTKASRGMTSQIDLMKSANRALLADNSVVTSNLDTIYRTAAAGADALGLSTTEAFDRITKGISAMQSRSLKEFGINVDASMANEAYAKSMGLVSGSLTMAQQEAAFATAAIAEMKDLLDRAGESALSTRDKTDQLAASWTNLQASLGKVAVESGAGNVLSGIVKDLDTATARIKVLNQVGWVEFVSRVGEAYLQELKLKNELSLGLITAEQYSQAMGLVNQALYLVPNAAGQAAQGVAGLNSELRTYRSLQLTITERPTRNLVQPSPFMAGGGSPSMYGTTVQQAETISANEIERQAEGKRRLGEYQSIYNDRLAEQKRIQDQIMSRAEAVLGKGLNVTAGDMANTAAGTYQNKPLEAARRLASIAERGFAELNKHGDWASILTIPPEVLAGSEAGLKAWAENTRQAVVDLTRPDLIDWGAFVANYQAELDKEAAKKNTLAIAMQKLAEAGLANGPQAAATVAQMFGVGSPQTAAESFASGFGQAIGDKDLSNLFLSAWQSDFDSGKDSYKTAGKALGSVIIEGVNTGVKDNLPGVRSSIAYYVAPEVARILNEKDPKK